MRYHFRSEPIEQDLASVDQLLTENGIFRRREVLVAIELVQDRLAKGKDSEYRFVFADSESTLAGFVCYGEITDLYWIAIRNDCKGTGLGKELLLRAEQDALNSGARAMFIETSSRTDYAPAQRFYEKNGYSSTCTVHDFYDRGDHKIILSKTLSP